MTVTNPQAVLKTSPMEKLVLLEQITSPDFVLQRYICPVVTFLDDVPIVLNIINKLFFKIFVDSVLNCYYYDKLCYPACGIWIFL